MALARSEFVVWMAICGLAIAVPSMAMAQDTVPMEDLLDMDFEELLNVEISVASKKSESLTEAPAVVVAVPREEIEIYGDRNLFQLMRRQPSVYTRSSQMYSDNVAAFRGDMATHAETHTLILLNGRPIRESGQGVNTNMYMGLPLAGLDSVELIRGPGSVLYGSNAFTGVINLKSRAIPEQSELSISSQAGSYGYYDTTVSGGGQFGGLGFVGAVRASGQDGYLYRTIDLMAQDGTDSMRERNISGMGHLEHGGLTVDFFASEIDNFAMGVWPTWNNPHHEHRNKKLFVNTGYRVPLHDRMTLELNATYNLQENSLTSPAPQLVGNNTSDLLGEATLFVNPVDDLDLIAGYLIEYQTNYRPDNSHYQSIPSYHYKPQSAYLQGDYRIDESIKLIAGGQWHRSGQGATDVTSRCGVVFTPFEGWGLKLLRGEAFRAPVAMETDLDDPLAVGNENLEPETITTYDIQLFYGGEKTYAAVTYFNSVIDDVIVYDPSVFPVSYMNGAEHKFDGVEFEGKHFITPNWHVLGSFMHQNNDPGAGINASPVPEDMFKLGTGYVWDSGSVSLFYNYFDAVPSLNPGFLAHKPEAVNLVSMNLRLDTSEWMGLEKGQSIFTLKVENLLDEDTTDVDMWGYSPYGPGLTVYAGLTYNF